MSDGCMRVDEERRREMEGVRKAREERTNQAMQLMIRAKTPYIPHVGGPNSRLQLNRTSIRLYEAFSL